jgi:hypothetical protein
MHRLGNQGGEINMEQITKDPPGSPGAKRHHTELNVRWANYYLECAGRENAPECKASKAALNRDQYAFGREGIMAVGGKQ